MTHTDSFDNLFKSLRDSEPYLPDDGFTQTVIGKLPSRREIPVWQKNLLILFSAIVGSALAATVLPVDKLPINTLALAFSSFELSGPVLAIAAAIIITLCGGAIWANERELI